MVQLSEILNSYPPISLQEMDGVRLMNRMDTKFLLNTTDLLDILNKMTSEYRVLEVDGQRQSQYKTLYYDSPGFYFYLSHHNGKRNRYKVRKREYVQSGISFLEVKFKTNKERTIKNRKRLSEIQEIMSESDQYFVDNTIGIHEPLNPILWNSFYRITLTHTSLPERITIDRNITYSRNSIETTLENLVIVEVKQESENRHSPFVNELKSRIIRPEGVSKYCLGVTLLYPGIKQNRFKEKFLRIKKITTHVEPYS